MMRRLNPDTKQKASSSTQKQHEDLEAEAEEKSGRPGRNRTRNHRFWRPVLYQLSYWPTPDLPEKLRYLARFSVNRMLPAEPTVLLEFHAIRVQPAVLVRIVIATGAITAGQRNQIPWHASSFNAKVTINDLRPEREMEPTTGLEPVTSSLPRRCSTD